MIKSYESRKGDLFVTMFLLSIIMYSSCGRSSEDQQGNGKLTEHFEYEQFEKDTLIKDDSKEKSVDHYEGPAYKAEKESLFSKVWSWFWRNIFTFILIGLVLYCLRRIVKINNRVKRHGSKIKKLFKDEAGTDMPIPKITSKAVKTEHNHKEFEEIKERLADLEERLSYVEAGEKRSEPVENLTLQEQKTEEIIFFPAPRPEMYFAADEGSSEFKQMRHFYRFESNQADPNMAKFYFVDDNDSAQFAINYPDGVLKNACEIENFFAANPRSIITKEPGTAKKQNGKWFIEKKSIISYE